MNVGKIIALMLIHLQADIEKPTQNNEQHANSNSKECHENLPRKCGTVFNVNFVNLI